MSTPQFKTTRTHAKGLFRTWNDTPRTRRVQVGTRPIPRWPSKTLWTPDGTTLAKGTHGLIREQTKRRNRHRAELLPAKPSPSRESSTRQHFEITEELIFGTHSRLPVSLFYALLWLPVPLLPQLRRKAPWPRTLAVKRYFRA